MSTHGVSMTLQESQGLEDLLQAAKSVLNNDIASAQETIANGASSFHQLGQGLLILLKTSLGFEGLWAKHAAQTLANAERTAASESRKIRSSPDYGKHLLFSPGSAEALCAAQAQLATAVVATLSQSMLEYMKGLYKIRQSYVALRKLADHERQRVKRQKLTFNTADHRSSETSMTILQRRSRSTFLYSPDGKEADELYDIKTPELGSLSDEYTYTGTYLCFGVMLVMLGMIPSAFQYVLRIIGFRGDKERGMAMLWEVTKFHNAHGALAALIILALYNAVRSACDIVDEEGYPKRRCQDLVTEMTSRYPNSVLWILEQGRMAAAQGSIDKAVEILNTPLHSAPRQLVALALHQKTVYQMFSHSYAACTEDFVKYTNETKYLHALYYYNAGCAQVELYRALKASNPGQAQLHKETARRHLSTATTGVDKTKLMATELPFDTFVTRKLSKWQAKSAQREIDLIDAVGPSPTEEMIYYYGGHKWMTAAQLDQSLLALGRSETSPTWQTEAVDDHAIHALLTGVVYRNQGKLDAAKTLFTRVLAYDKTEFQGGLVDNWVQPSACYELAVVAWLEKGGDGDEEALARCAALLDRVNRWGPYELDVRLTVKVKAALDVVNKARAARK